MELKQEVRKGAQTNLATLKILVGIPLPTDLDLYYLFDIIIYIILFI